ncbi:hypothetical protein M0R45_016982 [Rubus argutus]|uniref:DNA-directed RNA polymerase n=1 Tax=Rubus argutus TaxID=59490 RepID=A0AAW1XUM8_RUBAR
MHLVDVYSVLVHSGGVCGGHYYAFIRPTLSEQWYKFDDERVTKEDIRRALEEQYGGEEELSQTNPGFNNTPFEFTKYSNAYMLVYIRESGKDKMICNVDEKDIAEHQRSSWDILQAEVAQYINSNVRGVPYQTQAKTKPLNGLVQCLKGKTGHFHGNLCEKCVECAGRTVISPDSYLKITEDLFDSSGTTNIAFANSESIILIVDSRVTWLDTNEIGP